MDKIFSIIGVVGIALTFGSMAIFMLVLGDGGTVNVSLLTPVVKTGGVGLVLLVVHLGKTVIREQTQNPDMFN